MKNQANAKAKKTLTQTDILKKFKTHTKMNSKT